MAAELGLEPGDRVVAIDGQPITDILDYQYAVGEESFSLVIAKTGAKTDHELWEFDIERSPEESLGISFAEIAVDGMKTCQNSCVFCFVRQMPPGLRASLYEFDDDYRMSVSNGNYITLTNLSEEEFARILNLRVGPLYISVHAWDAQIRADMMGNPAAAFLPEQLHRLAQAGIVMHTQIVLVPGYNDGAVLGHTVRQLETLYPHVQSIGIVPVGLTRFRFGQKPLRVLTAQECARILKEGQVWQQEFRHLHQKNLVYFADEIYLSCGYDIPPPEEYDGFEQLENGIGMLSAFRNELAVMLDEPPNHSPPSHTRHLLTGILAAPFMGQCLDLAHRHATIHKTSVPPTHIHGIRNDFFGSQITVAGLVTATDIAAQLGNLNGEEFVVPRTMLRAGTEEFLDGHSVAWLERHLNGQARIVNGDAGGFVEALFGVRD
ncbi:MAG: DUF512 domain-containing protein [Peptococcaceae bacterium]|nr:DUF512 domain-containing protein [Peptococcaceae bacterium]